MYTWYFTIRQIDSSKFESFTTLHNDQIQFNFVFTKIEITGTYRDLIKIENSHNSRSQINIIIHPFIDLIIDIYCELLWKQRSPSTNTSE